MSEVSFRLYTDIIKETAKKEINLVFKKPTSGKLYTFQYDPLTKEKLSYYDKFPISLIYKRDREHFWGINFHYLSIENRKILLRKLFSQSIENSIEFNKEIEDINVSIKKIQHLAQSIWKPASKCYLYAHIVSRIIEIKPENFNIILDMPMIDNFNGVANSLYVFRDTNKKIRGNILKTKKIKLHKTTIKKSSDGKTKFNKKK